jgi:hypothetical protein
MATLDELFPHLSELVRDVRGLSLDDLSTRAPSVGFPFYDLERLLAAVREDEVDPLDGTLAPIFGVQDAQLRGYVATIDAYIGLGTLQGRKRNAFVAKKLMVPRAPRAPLDSSEMLDTIAECSWGLWLHDEYGNIEAEKPFPNGSGDADFYVESDIGPLWVDCMSPAPDERPPSVMAYLTYKTSGSGARSSVREVVQQLCRLRSQS